MVLLTHKGDDGANVCRASTVAVGAGGSMGATIEDTLLVKNTWNGETCCIGLTGNTFVVSYNDADGDGWISTITVSPSGAMEDIVEDEWEFEIDRAASVYIYKISTSVVAVLYQDPYGDGQLFTVSIAANGTITKSKIDTLEFDTAAAGCSRIINVVGEVYAIVYSDGATRGYVKTVTITSGGVISNAVIDTLEFESVTCGEVDACKVSDNLIAVAYSGVVGDDAYGNGWIRTVEIDASGNITDAIVDSLEFDALACDYPRLVPINDNVFFIAYRGDGQDGWCATIGIE